MNINDKNKKLIKIRFVTVKFDLWIYKILKIKCL